MSLPEGDENELQNVLATVGPVSVGFQATNNFQLYSSGVFTDTTCSPGNSNHAVILVGYGNDSNGNQYYILKNSYGTSWGMNGYMYFRRNYNNMCEIASFATYPIITSKYNPVITVSPKPLLTTKPTPIQKNDCSLGPGYYANPGK